MQYYLAVDIGASSGRHILGCLADGRLTLEEIYRFENQPVFRDGTLIWDVDALFAEVTAGIKRCAELGKIPVSMGIDTWGVDYAMLDRNGNRLGDCVAYRDSRTNGADTLVEAKIPLVDLYARTGIQKQIFNTIYQLNAVRRDTPELLKQADRLLFMPEYLNYLLTGVAMNEYTIGSTSGLLDARSKDWDGELLDLLGIPRGLFDKPQMPGTSVGRFSESIRAQVGFDCEVLLTPAHDTASAYLAVPAANENSVYISSGTWSLLGVENTEPITTADSLAAGFTNEGGYAYRFRYLKNIMGLWMIQSVRRELNKKFTFDELVELALQVEGEIPIVDVNDARFFAPDSMMDAVRQLCEENGFAVPQSVGEIVRCVYHSLAASYANTIMDLQKLTGKTYTGINIVGGGGKDEYLNRLTAEASGLPVLAGPVEGTAAGNLISQMLKSGAFTSIEDARSCVTRSFEIRPFGN